MDKGQLRSAPRAQVSIQLCPLQHTQDGLAAQSALATSHYSFLLKTLF